MPTAVYAVGSGGAMHWSADKKLWDRRTNKVDLIGHASVHQPGETLSADRILLDLDSRILDAKGHCLYITATTVIHADEMHFNLDTRTGTIIGGRVSNESFSLTGERINKLGEGRFQTHRGGYTTCRDCAPSWTLFGDDVDMEFEGYAFMSNVSTAIKDTPLFWIPYLIVPLKTKRQSGFLMPRIGYQGTRGFTFVPRFFWAINRSSDMTLGLGNLAGRGLRTEWQGRYQLTNGGATALWYYTEDKPVIRTHRFAFDLKQDHKLPWGFQERLHIMETSDNLYPADIGDVEGAGEAYYSSDFLLNRPSPNLSFYIAARRFRNLLNLDSKTDFDPNTVQVYPSVGLTVNDRPLFNSPFSLGLGLGMVNFARVGEAFDLAPPPDKPLQRRGPDSPVVLGQDPIRKATRFSMTPLLYTAFQPFGLVSLVPSFEYRAFFYSFHQEIKDLTRGYLLFKTDLTTQFERIFDTENPSIPKVKHLFRPILTYSLIPEETIFQSDRNHPFLQQISYAESNGWSGFAFDNHDVVPLDSNPTSSNYFTPLGHSVTYGLTTQIIRRRGALPTKDVTPAVSYQRILEARAGQTINIKNKSRPYSQFFSGLALGFDKWSATVDYTYVPYLLPPDPDHPFRTPHAVSLGFSLLIDRALHQRILTFERSLSLGYTFNTATSQTSNPRASFTYSINDYIMPSGSISWDTYSKIMSDMFLAVKFQSPSQCWGLDLSYRRQLRAVPSEEGDIYEWIPNIEFKWNLTGSGFSGVTDTVTGVVNR